LTLSPELGWRAVNDGGEDRRAYGSPERRRSDSRRALFRETVDRLLALAEQLPERPDRADLEPLQDLLLSVRDRLTGDPELEHRMRNILTITNLASSLAGPGEARRWLEQAVRAPVS
jgi:hypothetical protein